MNRVWGLCLNGIKISDRHKDKQKEPNAKLAFSYLLPVQGELNTTFRELPFNIYAVAEYYRKTSKLSEIFIALIQHECYELDIESDGVYTSKAFELDIKHLEKQIKKGMYKYESK